MTGETYGKYIERVNTSDDDVRRPLLDAVMTSIFEKHCSYFIADAAKRLNAGKDQ